MFTILYTVFVFAGYNSTEGAAVSTEQIGRYASVEKCEIIAAQLRTRVHSRHWTTARCVLID